MTNKDDLISREALKNAKPEFMNEKIVRDTKYRTTKDRIYAKAWNACNSYWLNTIDNAPTVAINCKDCDGYEAGYSAGLNDAERSQGEWIDHSEDYGYVECPFCHELTNCDGNKDELHYCWHCGAKLGKGGAE